MSSIIPNYASKIAEKYIPERNATLKIYAWRASKGYHTKFQAVPNLAVRVVNNDQMSKRNILLSRNTTSLKTMKEWTSHFKKEFDININLSTI